MRRSGGRLGSANPEAQPWPLARIGEGYGLPVADADRGNPLVLDIDAVAAGVDGHPVTAVEPQQQVDP